MIILIQASDCNDLNLHIASNSIPEPLGRWGWPWGCFPLLFQSTSQGGVSLSGAEAPGGRASLQQLPALQSQGLSGKTDKTEYLASSVRQHRSSCRNLLSLSLLPASVSCVLVRFFSVLLCSLVPLVALCAETVAFYTLLSSKYKFLIYSFYENPLCKETEGRGEGKTHKVARGRKGEIIEMLESLHFCDWHLTEARASLLYANGFVCIS